MSESSSIHLWPSRRLVQIGFSTFDESHESELGPDELECHRHLVGPHRRAEFTAGRRAARIALTQLGYPGTQVVMASSSPDEGRPLALGSSVAISISHADSRAVAAAAELEELGIDCESWDRRPSRRFEERVFAREELSGIHRLLTNQDPSSVLLTAWLVREAAWKSSRHLRRAPLMRTRVVIAEVQSGSASDAWFTARATQGESNHPEDAVELEGWVGRRGSHLVAICVPKAPAVPHDLEPRKAP